MVFFRCSCTCIYLQHWWLQTLDTYLPNMTHVLNMEESFFKKIVIYNPSMIFTWMRLIFYCETWLNNYSLTKMGNIQVLNNMQRIDTKAFKWLRICTFFLDHNLFLRARTASSNFVLSSPSCLRAETVCTKISVIE